MSLELHRTRIPLTQRPNAEWMDPRTTGLANRRPFIIAGCAARLEFAVLNGAGTAVVSPSGLSLITMEVYARRVPGNTTPLAAIIAPAVFAGTLNTDLTTEQWTGASPSQSHCHFAFDLTGAQTTVAFEIDAQSIEAWLEVYGTLSGERKLLGSGTLVIERSAAGGEPSGDLEQYYTQAQVDALLEDRPEITVSDGIASFTIGETTYSFPVGTAG